MRYGMKWPEYARQWDAMKVVTGKEATIRHVAEVAMAHKRDYAAIEAQTGVPWPMIAAIHRRESDANFNTYLGNGEPLDRKTRLVPKGRGPWPSFVAGAIDALKVDGLSSVIDWRLEKMLYYCELYNGTGYDMRSRPSPYVWALTNIQKPGKFRENERGSWFDSSEWDIQPGCAPIIWELSHVDPSVKAATYMTRET